MKSRDTSPISGVTPSPVALRIGIKGSDAPAWLQQQGVEIPALPNRVVHWHGGALGSGRCLRQGSSEFLIELDQPVASPFSAPHIANEAHPNIWPLLRSEFSLLLEGSSWPDALAEVCSFDFLRLQDEPDLVVMTVLAGISVTLVREPRNDPSPSNAIALRLWCDASYALYLQDCLRALSSQAAMPAGESR